MNEQMVKKRGEQVIRRDVAVQEYGLNGRQSRAVDYLMHNEKLTIQDYEALCPEVNRRTLQRDLKAMIDMELLVSEGSTNQLAYRMKG